MFYINKVQSATTTTKSRLGFIEINILIDGLSVVVFAFSLSSRIK